MVEKINVGIGGVNDPKSKFHAPNDTIINLDSSPVTTLDNESMSFYHDSENKKLKVVFKDDSGVTHESELLSY